MPNLPINKIFKCILEIRIFFDNFGCYSLKLWFLFVEFT